MDAAESMTTPEENIMTGSCLCGAVRYQIIGRLGPMGHCHCNLCRKAHGAAFATFADVRREHFRWLDGEALVKRFQSSRNAQRLFCANCGSHLVWESDLDTERIAIVIATLDDDPIGRPAGHIFVASKAPWFEITDGLPQHDALP